MKTGIQKKMADSRYMVSQINVYLTCKLCADYVSKDPDKEGPSDPLATLEKETQAQTLLTAVQKPRVEALQSISDHYNDDPYAHSYRVRRYFRSEKKVEKTRKDVDDEMKNKYALPESVALVADDDTAKAEAREAFASFTRLLEQSQWTFHSVCNQGCRLPRNAHKRSCAFHTCGQISSICVNYEQPGMLARA